MNGPLRLAIDPTALEELGRRLGRTPAQIDAARTRALKTTQASIEQAIVNEAAKELRMPKRGLDRRLYSRKIAPGDDTLRVWIGAYPLSPYRVGPVSTYGIPGKTGGVRAGSHVYPGAFIARVYGYERVWIRLHSKHYSPDLYPTRYRPGDRGYTEAGLRGRFPVVRAAVPIDAVLEKIVGKQERILVEEFLNNFSRELRDQVMAEQ